jgi:hypothetical protein
MRVLVSIEPRSYREALTVALRHLRPRLQVRAAAPEYLEEVVRRFRPHLVVCNEATSPVRANAVSWIEIVIHDGMGATVVVGERERVVEGVTLADLLAAIDETEGLISGG